MDAPTSLLPDNMTDFTTSYYSVELSGALLRSCALLYIECFTGPPRFERWSPEEASTYLASLLGRDTDFIVVSQEGQVAAFGVGFPLRESKLKDELVALGAREDAYYFAELCTSPRFRNRGLGARLQQLRERRARERGFHHLCVRVRADNETTIRLLERNGFAESGRYTTDNAGSTALRLIMTKSLNPAPME